jgi:hypothetical protein
MTSRVLGLMVAAGLAGASASAHHSIAGVYDGSQRVTIEGTVAEFQFVNPHPFVIVDAADGKAPPRRWRLELDNRHELVAEGMNADTLKPGDLVVVTGSPGRTLPHTMYVRRLDRRSDGFRYEQVGSSPRVRKAN